jgi:hypothetical protein
LLFVSESCKLKLTCNLEKWNIISKYKIEKKPD